MEGSFFDPSAPKRAANLSINSDLLRLAKERRLNLSQLLEGKLVELLREEMCRSWKEENAEAIKEYNDRIEKSGSFADHLRRF